MKNILVKTVNLCVGIELYTTSTSKRPALYYCRKMANMKHGCVRDGQYTKAFQTAISRFEAKPLITQKAATLVGRQREV